MSDSAAASVAVGDIVAEATYELTRDSLVRYAGASGDFNPIHYRDDIATSVGLPGVLAHGMLTMGIAVQPVVDWAGDSGRVTDYQVRFTRPVVVDPVTGATVSVVAKVGAIDDDGIRVDLTVTFEDQTVLGKAQVRVSLD
jgi:acyl dehydratase